MNFPDVQITVKKRFPPHDYILHLREQPDPVDCYIVTFEAAFAEPLQERKTYQFRVLHVLGRCAAIRACETLLRRLPGFEAAILKECRYAP